MMSDLRNLKALIIGAGSGRDIASAILVRESLRDAFSDVDLAGFLTPWALHSFDGSIERPINSITKKTKKFIPTKEDSPLKSFFEPFLIECNEKYSLDINNIYLFSLQYGTYILSEEIKRLVQNNGYDTIFVVDVGGDILASEDDCRTLLTPIVDLSCLEIMSEMPSSIKLYLSVISPGVCGEIGMARMASIIDEFRNSKFFVWHKNYTEQSQEYQKFKMVNNAINQKTSSYSHTEQIINRIVQYKGNENFKSIYEKKYRIGEKEYSLSFPVEIGRDYFNSIYYFDLKQVKSAKRGLTMRFHSVLEGFLKVRTAVCGTELDLSFVVDNFGNGNNNPIFLLTPCCYADANQRSEIMRFGVEEIKNGKIKYAITMKENKNLTPYDPEININDLGRYYCLLSSKKTNIKGFLDYLNKYCNISNRGA